MIHALLSAPRLGVKAYLSVMPELLRDMDLKKAQTIYVTDALRMISESAAKFGGGPYLKVRWADLAEPKKQDNRTGEEIAADVIRRAGLVVR